MGTITKEALFSNETHDVMILYTHKLLQEPKRTISFDSLFYKNLIAVYNKPNYDFNSALKALFSVVNNH